MVISSAKKILFLLSLCVLVNLFSCLAGFQYTYGKMLSNNNKGKIFTLVLQSWGKVLCFSLINMLLTLVFFEDVPFLPLSLVVVCLLLRILWP